MKPKSKKLAGKGTFAHGIHPPDHGDLSKDAAIRMMPTPDTVVLSLHQNIGGPCEPLGVPVKKSGGVS